MTNQTLNNQPLQKFVTQFQATLASVQSLDPVLERLESVNLSLTGPPICTPELETFKEKCGPYIKSLKLQISNLETLGQGSNGANHFFTTVRMLLGNVETLHLKLADQKNDPGYMTTGNIFEKIFSKRFDLFRLKVLRLTLTSRSIDFSLLEKFPGLQELVLRAVNDGNDPVKFPTFLSHLSAIRSIKSQKNPEFLNLKTLDTIGVPNDTLRNLMFANLAALEHLALSVTCGVLETDLRECLSEYKSNLKSLKLLRCKTRSCKLFSILPSGGYLDNLKEMELWGSVMSSLDFLFKIPTAKKLRVDYYCFDCPYYFGKVRDGPAVFQGDMVHNSSVLRGYNDAGLFPCLQEFVTDCKIASYSWNELVIWMPNLRVLEARIPDNFTLLDLCDYLVMLEKLRLRFGSDVDDDGIVRRSDDDLYGGGEIRPRGITNLKHLHTFELEVECGQGKLTDQSSEWGFLKVESLRSLKLGFTGNLLTEEMEKRLRERIEQVELYRSCSKTCEGEKIQRCCEWADFKLDWQID